MNNKKEIQEAMLQAVDTMIDQKLKTLKFNYYVDGVIQQVHSDNTYKVSINQMMYDRVPSLHRMDFQINDVVQILVKNGDWNKKYIVDKTKADNTHNLYNIGERPVLPEGANLNNYLTVGCWGVYGNAIAKTLINCPSVIAGNFTIECALGQTKEEPYVYLTQRYETVDGYKYFRYCRRNGNDAEWIFGDWMLVLDTQQVKDYVIEEGKKEVTDPNTNLKVAWTYRKWNSGIAECWISRNVNVNVNSAWGSALYYGTVSTINFPFQFAEVPVVNVTCEYSGDNSKSLFIASCGYSSKNYARPTMLCRTDTGTVNCNLLYQVQGRWK